MNTKKASSAQGQNYKTIREYFSAINFNKLAIVSGFKKRKTRKLNGQQLIFSFMIMALKGRNTFQLWTEEIGLMTSQTISKQAICKRISASFVHFVYAVLTASFSEHIKAVCKKVGYSGSLKNYKNILIQDSTIISLPQCLNMFYPGNYSRGEIKALIRIQLVIELRSAKVVHFAVTRYSKNDQSMSEEIISVAKKGDLVIRDMGYFSLNVFEKMKKLQVSFVSRLKPSVKIFETKTEREINLAKILTKEKHLDRWVLVGAEQKVSMRIVAIKLPDEIANEKIRKEKRNRNKRLNHSKEYYELMHYTIYITTEERSTLSAKLVAQTYRLRWRIETIFKTWKSNFHMQNLIPCNIKISKERAESIIYLILIFILQFQLRFYKLAIEFHKNRKINLEISLSKLSKFIADRINEILDIKIDKLLKHIGYYCRYDKRRDRENYYQTAMLS